MKQRGKRTSPLGCLVAITLCGMVMLVLPRVGRSPAESISRPQSGTPSVAEEALPTQVTSPTLIAPPAERTFTPLESEVTALVGVRTLRSVVSVDGIVYMEIDVEQGYAAQPFAEVLLEVARRYGTVEDFSTMLNDGINVPVSFLWRNGTWNGAQMIQHATLVQATSQSESSAPISLPSRTPAPYVPPLPTAVIVSPYTCNGVDDLNCDAFNDPRQAQAHMLMCGDEDDLDGNENGQACEN